MDIAINIHFNGIVLLTDKDITCFDHQYQPKNFNFKLIKNEYRLTEGDEVSSHQWISEFILKKLVVNDAICHVKMFVDQLLIAHLNECKVHLYHDLTNVILSATNSKIIANNKLKNLYLQCHSSVVKGFDIENLYATIFDSFITLKAKKFTVKNDYVSNITINGRMIKTALL